MTKLMINGKEELPKKKIKLYRKIKSARVREILINPDKLQEFKDEMKEKPPE